MRKRWLLGVVAVTALLAVSGCNDGAAGGTPTDVSAAMSSDAGAQQASENDSMESAASGAQTSEAQEPDDDADAADVDSSLPADPMAEAGPFDVDACAVLVRAVGAEAVEAALGDPVTDSGSLFANCSMYTADYTINEAGSTSTGRLSFGVSPTSLEGIAAPDAVAVDGLTDSKLDKSSILWHRAPYWFTLQVLPVQKQATDPDLPDPESLVALARLIDANA